MWKSINLLISFGAFGEKNMIKLFLRINKNWSVFLCGVLTNIPVTLLFCFKPYGFDCWSHAYFWALVSALVISCLTVFVAYRFAIKIISIKESLEDKYREERIVHIIDKGKTTLQDVESVEKRIQEKLTTENDADIKYLKRHRWGLVVLFAAFVILVGFMWIINGLNLVP